MNVPQGHILVRGDVIKEVKEYVYLGWMVNMCRDMDAEISRRILTGKKTFTIKKYVLKVKAGQNPMCQSLR